ncbi:hypothetical protein LRC484719_53990 [Mycobacterium riyadhense]
MLGVSGSRSTPGTLPRKREVPPRMAARNVGMQPPKTGSPKRCSSASGARIAAQADEMAARNILRAGLALHAQAA